MALPSAPDDRRGATDEDEDLEGLLSAEEALDEDPSWLARARRRLARTNPELYALTRALARRLKDRGRSAPPLDGP